MTRNFIFGKGDQRPGSRGMSNKKEVARVADELGENVQTLGPRRAKIINKGMIYSPAHGDIAFTVPMFENFLKRLENSNTVSRG